MKSPPEKTITLTFKSCACTDNSLCWKATLVFAPDSDEKSVLPIAIEDGNGDSIASGVFEFAGKEISICRGQGELKYVDFIAGIHEKAIWLKRRGKDPIPGLLTFA